MQRRRLLALAAAAALSPRFAAAQAFPARPLRLVVPFTAGGNSDVLARLLAERLGETLRQPVAVENRPGASATIGTEAVARGAPDGYSLILSNNQSFATAPLIYPRLGYRPLEDFAHLFLIGSFANAFVVSASDPAASLAEFVARSRANPGRLTFGSSGTGSAGHLTGELLKRLAGIDLVHVPYKGSAQALIALLAAQIDATFNGVPTTVPVARAGKVRVLAVSGSGRSPEFPDAPAMSESVPGAIGVAWFGVSAPARTPKSALEVLEREGLRVLQTAAMQAKLAGIGATPGGLGAADYTRFIEAEIRKWAPIVRATGVKVE